MLFQNAKKIAAPSCKQRWGVSALLIHEIWPPEDVVVDAKNINRRNATYTVNTKVSAFEPCKLGNRILECLYISTRVSDGMIFFAVALVSETKLLCRKVGVGQ